MKEFTGTKGKWKVWLGNSTYKVTDTSFRDVLSIEELNNIDEAEANAQVMAVAPEMLKRLKSVQLMLMAHPDYVCHEDGEFIDQVDFIEELINKALGE